MPCNTLNIDIQELTINKLKTPTKAVNHHISRISNKKSALSNINIIYESPEAVTELFNGYFSIVSEWIHNRTKSRGLKMLTSKQELERLPIPLAQTSKSRQ